MCLEICDKNSVFFHSNRCEGAKSATMGAIIRQAD